MMSVHRSPYAINAGRAVGRMRMEWRMRRGMNLKMNESYLNLGQASRGGTYNNL
jgi:hypothetical protein